LGVDRAYETTRAKGMKGLPLEPLFHHNNNNVPILNLLV